MNGRSLERCRAYFQAENCAPITRDELAKRLGISPNHAGKMLSVLRYEGMITMTRGRSVAAVYRRAA
jgi:DNA-binding IscR family transcriptional regulator